MSKLNEEVSEFCSTMARDFLERSNSPSTDVWPQPVFNGVEGNHFVHSEIFNQLHECFTVLDHAGYSNNEIAELFRFPSRPIHLAYLLLHPAQTREEAEIKTRVLSKILSILRIQRNSNPFCTNGVNSVLSQAQATNLYVTEPMCEVCSHDAIDRKTISELIVSLLGYVELIYFANLAFGKEFHGPYKIDQDKILVVRDYYDMQPKTFEFTESFPYSEIRIMTTYPNDVDVSFDVAGRMKGHSVLGPKLKEVMISVDGEIANTDRFEALNEDIQTHVKHATQKVREMDREELMTSWIENYFWIISPLKEELGMEKWQPPRHIYERIQNEEPDTEVIEELHSLGDMKPDKAHQKLTSMFDPRMWGEQRHKTLGIIHEI